MRWMADVLILMTLLQLGDLWRIGDKGVGGLETIGGGKIALHPEFKSLSFS